MGFALRGDLADHDIARLDFGTDTDDARFVQILQGVFTEVRDIVGNLFLAEFGVSGDAFEFLDMNRGITIFLDQFFGNENRILEVVTFPGHESDQNILTKSQFTPVGRRTVGDNLTTLDHIANLDDRLLVKASVLIGTDKLDEIVNINTGTGFVDFIFIDLDDDTAGVNRLDDAVMTGNNRRTGVMGDDPLHAGTDQRGIGTQQRHSLALHVRTHQGAVGVIVLEERNQRGGNRNQLLRRNVHQFDVVLVHQHELAALAGIDQFINEAALLVERRVRLGDRMSLFLERREILDFVGDLTVIDDAVRGFDETVLVNPGIGRQRSDQTDVRTFRGLDRANSTVVGRVNVTHFEAGALTGQATRAECRKTPLVGNLGKRVGLVHKLGELRRTEELLDHC